MKQSDYKSLEYYLKTCRELGKEVGRGSLIEGEFYSFSYKFKEPRPPKFYDIMPLIFVTSIKNDSFFGVNLHHMPVLSRQYLLTRISGVELSYENAVILNKSVKYAVRQYCKDGIGRIFLQDRENIEFLAQFFSNTYMGSYTSAMAEFKRRKESGK